MEKLKLCPFCDGEAEIVETLQMESSKNKMAFWSICKNCKAASCFQYTKEEAIKAWNTRADAPNNINKEEAHGLMYNALGGTVPFAVFEILNYILDSYSPEVSIDIGKEEIYESIEPKNVVAKYEQKYNGKSIMYSSADLEYGEEVIVTIQKKKS